MTLREFLQMKAGENGQPERQQRREEWVAAVGRLVSQLRAWLAEADPDKRLDVAQFEIETWERKLGGYLVPKLKIGFGARTIDVEPMGRYALGQVELPGQAPVLAEGRVDMTAGPRRYILYRLIRDGRDVWYALDEQFRAAPLDRERLEAILQDLLS
jgi:hypothetical protein